MSKPRILILMHYMELGGAEMALLGLLDAIDKSKYEVDLFLNQHTGPFMPLIPEGVNVLPEIKEYTVLERPISYAIKKGYWKAAMRKLIRKYKFRNYLKKNPGYASVASHFYMDCEIKKLPDLSFLGEYDLAVSFLDPPHIVQDKVNAKRKIEWIHTDFATVKYDVNLTYERWAKNDYIVSISDDITKSFTSIFPSLKEKIVKIENIISSSFVRQRAQVPIDLPFCNEGKTLLCSIGRINSEAKNFKIIPFAASILKSSGIDFAWMIIGPGEDQEIKDLIKKCDVADNVFLLGPKDNPYPYIAKSDIYIQPSLWEGKSIAVREAQILCKPVVITNYPTAASQLSDGVDGLICGMNPDEIATSIKGLIQDTEKQKNIIAHLADHDYGMMDEVNKFYKLIDHV